MKCNYNLKCLWIFLILFCNCFGQNKLIESRSATFYLKVSDESNSDFLNSPKNIKRMNAVYYKELCNNIGAVIDPEKLKKIKNDMFKMQNAQPFSMLSFLKQLNKKNCKFLLTPEITDNNTLTIAVYPCFNLEKYNGIIFSCYVPLGIDTLKFKADGKYGEIDKIMKEATDSISSQLLNNFKKYP